MNKNDSHGPIYSLADAIVTTDYYGYRAYVWADGTIIARDGAGRMCWTTHWPCAWGWDSRYATSRAEAIAELNY